MVKIIKIIVLNLFLLNNIYANSKLILEKYSNSFLKNKKEG